MVKVVTEAGNRTVLQQFIPEAMLLTYTSRMTVSEEEAFLSALQEAEKWADCILTGPGIGLEETARKLLRYAVLQSELPLVIDADGINILAGDSGLQEAIAGREEQKRTVILTPHLGEFARLYGCVAAEAKENLREYPLKLCERLRCVVVCKDARTVVVQHQGEQGYLNVTGNSGMATAGSGDVLAGMITGLLAQGMTGMDAAVAGVYLHGCAGNIAAERKSEIAMTATDIIDCIPDAIKQNQD